MIHLVATRVTDMLSESRVRQQGVRKVPLACLWVVSDDEVQGEKKQWVVKNKQGRSGMKAFWEREPSLTSPPFLLSSSRIAGLH